VVELLKLLELNKLSPFVGALQEHLPSPSPAKIHNNKSYNNNKTKVIATWNIHSLHSNLSSPHHKEEFVNSIAVSIPAIRSPPVR
jgi:hypothetical protein